jgi:hypothetical protein
MYKTINLTKTADSLPVFINCLIFYEPPFSWLKNMWPPPLFPPPHHPAKLWPEFPLEFPGKRLRNHFRSAFLPQIRILIGLGGKTNLVWQFSRLKISRTSVVLTDSASNDGMSSDKEEYLNLALGIVSGVSRQVFFIIFRHSVSMFCRCHDIVNHLHLVASLVWPSMSSYRIFCVEFIVLPHRNWQIQIVFIILLTKIYGILGIKNPDS